MTKVAPSSTVSLPSTTIPSSATTATSILVNDLKHSNEWSNSSSDNRNGSPVKRQKMENKIDIDDNCSNDAFVFTQHHQQQQKQIKATTVAPSTAVK